MSLNAVETKSDFEMAPAGVHPARCYRIVDLGSQKTDFQGQARMTKKVLIAWELLGDEVMSDGRPFVISKRYTVSLAERATLRKDLEAWRGKAFAADELKGFHLGKLAGAYCLLSVVHQERNGVTYANIGSLMALPKGMPKPAPVNDLVLFDLDSPDWGVFESFGERLKEMIASSPEFQSSRQSADTATPFDPSNPAPDALVELYRQPGRPARNAKPAPKPEPALAEADFDDDVTF